MSSLVTFDEKGPFGPTMQLMFNLKYYSSAGLLEIANLCKQNLKNVGISARGKKEFCVSAQVPLTPTAIIGTRFFQTMLKLEPSKHHDKAVQYMVPCMLETLRQHIPHAQQQVTPEIVDWIARFVTGYMTEEQIEKHCSLQATISPEINAVRGSIGSELYQAVTKTKKITEPDLDVMVSICRTAMDQLNQAPNRAAVLNFVIMYLGLFSMNEQDPESLAEDVLDRLEHNFKPKVFPKGAEDEIKPQ